MKMTLAFFLFTVPTPKKTHPKEDDEKRSRVKEAVLNFILTNCSISSSFVKTSFVHHRQGQIACLIENNNNNNNKKQSEKRSFHPLHPNRTNMIMHNNNAGEDNVPEEFICPITNEIMKNPLMSIHGFNFEREAIFEWLQTHSTCPLSRRELNVSKLVTNCALRERIRGWCEANHMMHLLSPRHDHHHNNTNDGVDGPIDDDDEDEDGRRYRLVLGISISKQQQDELTLYHQQRQRQQQQQQQQQHGVDVGVVERTPKRSRVARVMARISRQRRHHDGASSRGFRLHAGN